MVQNLILKRSAMTFTFDLETWFKITAHPLHKNSVYGKYEQGLLGESTMYVLNTDILIYGMTLTLELETWC